MNATTQEFALPKGKMQLFICKSKFINDRNYRMCVPHVDLCVRNSH